MTNSYKIFVGVALVASALTLGCASSPERPKAPEPASPVVAEQEVLLVQLTGLT